MNFNVKTILRSTTKETVLAGFTSAFFLQLAPPFPRLRLLRYDGCDKGHEIHLELNFLLYTKHWVSVITESGQTEYELYFIDEGTTVPNPIRQWKHRHGIRQIGDAVEIDDAVSYRSGNKFLDVLLLVPLYLLFFYRKPVYKKCFGKRKTR